MRNRMFLYSISEGAGLISFCFMMIEFASTLVTLEVRTLRLFRSTIPRRGGQLTTHASEKDVTVRHSLTDKLSLYFHTTHDSFLTFV